MSSAFWARESGGKANRRVLPRNLLIYKWHLHASVVERGLALSRMTAASQERLHREGIMRMTVGLLLAERLWVLCLSLGRVWVFPHPAQAEDPFCRHASLLWILLLAGRILPLPKLSLATLHKTTHLQELAYLSKTSQASSTLIHCLQSLTRAIFLHK